MPDKNDELDLLNDLGHVRLLDQRDRWPEDVAQPVFPGIAVQRFGVIVLGNTAEGDELKGVLERALVRRLDSAARVIGMAAGIHAVRVDPDRLFTEGTGDDHQ